MDVKESELTQLGYLGSTTGLGEEQLAKAILLMTRRKENVGQLYSINEDGYTSLFDRLLVKVSANAGTALVLTDNGKVFLVTLTDSVELPLPNIIDIAVGYTNSYYAVTELGEILAWGDNSYGALGIGDNITLASEPRRVIGITGAISITAGLCNAFCICLDGRGYAWGKNINGNLGTGTGRNYNIPTPMICTDIKLLGVSTILTVVLSKEDIFIWGRGIINPAPIRLVDSNGMPRNITTLTASANCVYILTDNNVLYTIYGSTLPLQVVEDGVPALMIGGNGSLIAILRDTNTIDLVSSTNTVQISVDAFKTKFLLPMDRNVVWALA